MISGLFYVVLPLVVLIINLIVVREVRRASHNASINLGHQSSSAVPSVMLVTTSLVYVLLSGLTSVLYEVNNWIPFSAFSYRTVSVQSMILASALSRILFSYNFCLYSITGKQFRTELLRLFSRCYTTIR